MRRWPLVRWAFALGILFFVGGCAAILSQAYGVRPGEYDVQDVRTVMAPMRDGVRLATDLYLPKTKGPFPAILVRTPYGKGSGQSVLAKIYAKRGYAVAVQDVRGRFDSEGEWDPFRNEGPDGADTVAWIRRQPWNNDVVGLFGMSYFGFTQWQAASYTEKSVQAMTPTVTGSRIYDILYRQGVFSYLTAMGWGVANAGHRTSENIEFSRILNWDPPLMNAEQRFGRSIPFFKNWVKHETFDAYWRPASSEGRWESVNAPVLMVGGWYDLFAGSMLSDWQELNAKGGRLARRESRLIMGPWAHTFNKKLHGVNFGSDADFLSFSKIYLEWFDAYLMGQGKIDLPRVRVFTTGINEWRNLGDWPPPNARVERWYLHSGGQAQRMSDGDFGRAKPGSEIPDQFVHDPAKLVPTLGGALYPPEFAGPADVAKLGQRDDVLVYTSKALTDELEITGPIRAKVWFSASTPDADIAVSLLDVDDDGAARILVDGIARARYRNGDRPVWLEPGKPTEIEVDLWGISHIVKKGHKLRVHVAASNFPRFAPNPCTAEEVGAARQYEKSRIKLYHDDEHPSLLLLSVR